MIGGRDHNFITITGGDDTQGQGSTTNSTGPDDNFFETNKKGMLN